MPRPRTPTDKARASGADLNHPSRFQTAPAAASGLGPVGGPPDWLNKAQSDAWLDLVDTLPWLDRSHGGITSIAAVLTAKLRDNTANMSELNLLRLCLGQMGATPADARRVNVPAAESDDPAEAYFR